MYVSTVLNIPIYLTYNLLSFFNLLAPEFGIQILAHPVCKM